MCVMWHILHLRFFRFLKTAAPTLWSNDNPGCVLVRSGKLEQIPYEVHEIEGKKIRDCSLNVALGDYFVLMSDGVTHAGVGNMMSFGWGQAKSQRVYTKGMFHEQSVSAYD